MSFQFIKSLFGRSLNSSKIMQLSNDVNFQLISKLPFTPHYNSLPIKFVPTMIKNFNIPEQGLYFNYKISCADDIVYFATKELNGGKNSLEYRALGFKERFGQLMMDVAKNPITAKAKYIIFTSVAIGAKYGNAHIGVLENENPDADPNLTIEYDIYNTVNGQ